MTDYSVKTLRRATIREFHVALQDVADIGQRVLVSPAGQPGPARKKDSWQGVEAWWPIPAKEVSERHPVLQPVLADINIAGSFTIISRDGTWTPAGRAAVFDAMQQWFPFSNIVEYRSDLVVWANMIGSADGGEAARRCLPIIRRRRYRNEEHRMVKDELARIGYTLMHRGNDRYWLVRNQPMTLDEIERLVIQAAEALPPAPQQDQNQNRQLH